MVDRSDDNRAEYNGNKNTGKLVVPNKDMEGDYEQRVQGIGPLCIGQYIFSQPDIFNTVIMDNLGDNEKRYFPDKHRKNNQEQEGPVVFSVKDIGGIMIGVVHRVCR